MSTTAVPQTGTDATAGAWDGFVTGPWCDGIDVRDFIQRNYTPHTGDAAFLAGPTERTTGIWAKLSAMFPEEGTCLFPVLAEGDVTWHDR